MHHICATHKLLIEKIKKSIEHGCGAGFPVKDTNSNEFDSPARDLALVQKTKRMTNTHECLFKPIEGKSTQIPNDRKIMHNKIIKTDIVVAQITIQHES